MKTILLTLLLLLAAILLLGVKVLFVKGGTFPTGHAHDIKGLRDKGIGCAHNPDKG